MPTPEQVEAAKHLSEAHQKANRDAGKEPCDCPVCIIAAALRESEARVKELESRHENLVPERDQARAEAFCFRQERDEQKARAEKAEAECAKYKERWLRSKGSEDARIPHQRVFALLLSFRKMRLRLVRLRTEVERLRKVVDAAKIVVDPLRRVPRSLNEQALMSAIAALEEGHGG